MAGPTTGRRQRWKGRFDGVCPRPPRACCCRMPRSIRPRCITPRCGSRSRASLPASPNLRVIFNLGAGVDALMADRSLPDVPLVRVAVTDLTARMTEYVVLHVLMHHRQELYLRESPARQALGAEICNGRRARSRSASWGWARSAPMPPTRCKRSAFASRAGAEARRQIDGIDCFHGEAQFDAFLRAHRYPGLPAAADAGYAAHPQPRAVRETQPQQPARRAGPDQCRPRRPAERSRHPAMPRRRHARRRLARRLRHRAAAGRQPVLDPSKSGADAAQRRRYRSRRDIEICRAARSRASRPAARWRMWSIADGGIRQAEIRRDESANSPAAANASRAAS